MVNKGEKLIDSFIGVTLRQSDDFLKIRETLSRIGVASKKEKTLYQSCHILHKQGHFYIVHFKEMFMLDGKETNFTEEDKARRNTIANLLHDWELLDLVDESKTATPTLPMSMVKVIPFRERDLWTFVVKYNIGKKKDANA